jgi:hypothetical protein
LQICLDWEGVLISKPLGLCCNRSALNPAEVYQMNPYTLWTTDEDNTFYRLVRTAGHKWKTITALMDGRSMCYA